ncbi:DUF6879 family protein [Actinokineospora iranica]|uniref:DUF6879 domain-containing protein n=1 Tax=Actinokineospora iranica TaxID=1271860 RepID=A0A1G6YW66_9PSEU|nr:DUF6879 family protein [Actinokineospora iranica]SDD94588.1 hypothetical protein SAMN05216174_1245 [Actinokineospora iranica]
MPDLVRGEDFASLFRRFTRSAWRWEAQGTYRQPDEVAPWQRWREGVPVANDLDWLGPWLDDVRAATRAGKRFERVRLVTDPLTEYLRWQMEVTPANIEAGEVIRLLPAADARALGLPVHDFWLFDDERVAVLHFGDTGLTGAEIITDPATVAQHQSWRDVAWRHAVAFEDYASL